MSKEKTMYLAEHNETKEVFSFTRTSDDKLTILGNEVNENDFTIIQVSLQEINAENLNTEETTNNDLDKFFFSFDEREPKIGDYVSLVWEDGSDCECTYNGLDKSILPLPTHWYYVNNDLDTVSSNDSRCFIMSATFNIDKTTTITQCFGSKRKDFPTIKDLKNVVISYHEKANNIVILSVCEVKNNEFDKFFSEQ